MCLSLDRPVFKTRLPFYLLKFEFTTEQISEGPWLVEPSKPIDSKILKLLLGFNWVRYICNDFAKTYKISVTRILDWLMNISLTRWALFRLGSNVSEQCSCFNASRHLNTCAKISHFMKIKKALFNTFSRNLARSINENNASSRTGIA